MWGCCLISVLVDVACLSDPTHGVNDRLCELTGVGLHKFDATKSSGAVRHKHKKVLASE